MSFIDLFSDQAKLYAAARPRYPDELFTFIASRAPAHARAWDCGTGNGQAALSLARHFSEVLGSDPSAEQIAHATPKHNVRYSVQPAEATNFPDRHFDAVCVAQAIHWFDFDRFFAEVSRVAIPGAIFAAWGYAWFEISPEFDAVFNTAVRDVIAPCWPEQSHYLWNGYREVPFPFTRIATPEFRIRVTWNFQQFLAYVLTWSAIRRCIAASGPEFFESAQRRLSSLWGTPETERQLEMPIHLWLGRVT